MGLESLNVVEKANEGSILELLNPFNGEPLTDEGEKVADKDNVKPFYLKLLGADSDVYRSAMNRRLEKNLNKKNKKVDLEESKIRAAELLAKCTTDCYLIEDGKVVACDTATMTRLYLKYPWMQEQAEAFIGDRSNLVQS